MQNGLNGKDGEEGAGLLGGNAVVPYAGTNGELAEHVNGGRFFVTKARAEEKQRLNRFFDALGGAERANRRSPVVPHSRVYTNMRCSVVLGVAIASLIAGASVSSSYVETGESNQDKELSSLISALWTQIHERLEEAEKPDAWSIVPSGCSVSGKKSAQGICAVQVRYISPEWPHSPVNARVLCRDRDVSKAAGEAEKPFYSDIGNLRLGDIIVNPQRPELGYGRPLSEEHKVNHATEARFCHLHCHEDESCHAWTVWGGNCWLKYCNQGDPGCPTYWDNDIGGHKMTNTSKHFAVWGIKGCNFITSILEKGFCKVVLADASKIEEELDHLPYCEDYFHDKDGNGAPCRKMKLGAMNPEDACLVQKDRPTEKVQFQKASSFAASTTDKAHDLAHQIKEKTSRISHQPRHTFELWRGFSFALAAWCLLGLGMVIDARLDRRAERGIRDISSPTPPSNGAS